MSAAVKKRTSTTLDEDELLQEDAVPSKKSRSNDGDDTFEEEELDEDALLGLSDNEEQGEQYDDGSGYQLDEDGGYDVMAGEDDFAEEVYEETDALSQEADGGYAEEEEEEYMEEGTEGYQGEDANYEEEETDAEQGDEQYNEGTTQEFLSEPIFDDVLDIDITDDSLIKELEDDSGTSGPSSRRTSGTFMKPSAPPPKSSSTPKTIPKPFGSPQTHQTSATDASSTPGKRNDDGSSLLQKDKSGGIGEIVDESADDDDEEEDSEEKEARGGRFRSERKEIVSLKSSRNRDIPDTLELSEQSKKELEEFERQEEEKRQQRRQRQQNWRGRRGGRGQRGWFERGRGVNNIGRMPFGHEQFRHGSPFGPRGSQGMMDRFRGPRPLFHQHPQIPIIPIRVQPPLITLTNSDFAEDDAVNTFEHPHEPSPPPQIQQSPPGSRGRSPTRPVIHVNPHFRGQRPQLPGPTSHENSSVRTPQPVQSLAGQSRGHHPPHTQSHDPSTRASPLQPPQSTPPQMHPVYGEESSWKEQHHQPPSSQGQHWPPHHPPVSQHEHTAPASSWNHPHATSQNEPVYAQSTIENIPPLLPMTTREGTYHAPPHQQLEHQRQGHLQRDGQHHGPPDQHQNRGHHSVEWFEAEGHRNDVHLEQHHPGQHHRPQHPPAHHQTRFPGPGQPNRPQAGTFQRSSPDHHHNRFMSPPHHQNQSEQQGQWQKNESTSNLRPVPTLDTGNAPQQPRRTQLAPPPQAIIEEASKQQQQEAPKPASQEQSMPEDNDPETQRLRLQIEEQKKLREEVVKRKEQRRQQLAAKRQMELKKRMAAQKQQQQQQQAAQTGNQPGQQQPQPTQQGQQQQQLMNKQHQQQTMTNEQVGHQQQGQQGPVPTKQPSHPGVQQVHGRGAKMVNLRGKPMQQRRNSGGHPVKVPQGGSQSGPLPLQPLSQPPPQQYDVPFGQPIIAIGGGPSKPPGQIFQQTGGNRPYQRGGVPKNMPTGGRGQPHAHQQQNVHQQGNFQRGGMATRRSGRGQTRGHVRGRGRGNVNQQQRQGFQQGQNIETGNQLLQLQNQPHGPSGMQGPSQRQPYQQPQQQQQQFQQQHHQPQQRGRGQPGKTRGAVKQRLGRGGFQQSQKMPQQHQQPLQRGGMQLKRGRGGGQFHPNIPQGVQRQHSGSGDAPVLNPQCGVAIEGLAENTHGDDLMSMMISVGPVQALKMYPNHRKAIGFFFNPNDASAFQQRFNGSLINFAPVDVKLIWRHPP